MIAEKRVSNSVIVGDANDFQSLLSALKSQMEMFLHSVEPLLNNPLLSNALPKKEPQEILHLNFKGQIYSLTRSTPKSLKLFSQRELMLAELLKKGFSYKDIANQLGIRYPTVSSHMQRIFRKFGVNSRAELLRVIELMTPQAEIHN